MPNEAKNQLLTQALANKLLPQPKPLVSVGQGGLYDPNTQQLVVGPKPSGEKNAQIVHEPLGDGRIQDYQITVGPDGKAIKTKIDAPYKANPTGMGSMASLTPEQNDALFGPTGAVTTGKLSPDRVNSRTARILADAYIRNPTTDMNRLATDAALMRNANYMGRSLNLETIPTVLNSMVEAGRRVNYSDAKIVGEMQKFLMGQSNDPDLARYMAIRNDSLLSIAATMRGVGMSDQAHAAEIEAQSPTMSPRALDGWAAGQMEALRPKLAVAGRFTRTGDTTANPHDPGYVGNGGPGAAPVAPITKTINGVTYVNNGGGPNDWHRQ
jgi:hypothetical protein